MKTFRQYLELAEKEQIAIGHFNISDSEGFRAIVEGAVELNLPVIIGISEGERDFIGLNEAISLVRSARENSIPVFINADHTYTFKRAARAIDAGIDSIILDAADKPFDENVKLTKEVVDYARLKNSEILVEGELGFIGKSSKVLENLPDGVSIETQTKPVEAKEFVKLTGIDLFAPSVGNVHGMVKTGNPELNTKRIREIKETVDTPLVLHGGSGIKDENFREAIKAGVRIIHINTELRMAYKQGIEEGLKSEEIAPYKFMAQGVANMKKVVQNKLKLFNNL